MSQGRKRNPLALTVFACAAVLMTAFVPTEMPIAAAEPGASTAAPIHPNVEFNSCTCLDLSQIKDCRSGTCYKYCKDRWRQDSFQCEGRKITCPHYISYTGWKPWRCW